MIASAFHPERGKDIYVIDGMRSALSEVIELVSLQPLSKAQSELTYWVAPAFWNKGVEPVVTDALIQQNPMRKKIFLPPSLRTTQPLHGFQRVAALLTSEMLRRTPFCVRPRLRPGNI